MGCNVLHGALLLLFIATLTAVRGLPVEGQSSPSSCSPHLLTPNGNGSEMEVDIYTYYRSGYPGCLGIFLSNMFNSKRGGHAFNELVLKKEDGALICNGFVRLLSLIDGYGLTPKMCDGKALANEQREFCTKTYAVKKAQISELASRLDEIGVSGLSDAARVVSSLDDHCEDVCNGIFNSALCGGFVNAGLFFMANYDTAVKNKVGSGTESELGEQQGTTETEQPSLKSGEEEKVTTQLDSQSTVRIQPVQQPTDSSPTLSPQLMKYLKEHPEAFKKFLERQKSASSPPVQQPDVPTIQPSQQEPQRSSQPPQKPQLSQDDIARIMSLLKSSDIRNPPDDKAPGGEVPSQSRYEQTTVLQDGGQETSEVPDQSQEQSQPTLSPEIIKLINENQESLREFLQKKNSSPLDKNDQEGSKVDPSYSTQRQFSQDAVQPSQLSLNAQLAQLSAQLQLLLSYMTAPLTLPSDVSNPPDEKTPEVEYHSQSRYEQTNDAGELNGDDKLPEGWAEEEQDDELYTLPSDEETPPVEGVETPAAEGFETPAVEGFETPAVEGVEVEALLEEYEEEYSNMDPTLSDVYMGLSVMPKVAFEGGAVESRNNARDDVLLLFAVGLIVIAIGIGIYQYSEEKKYQAEKRLQKEVKVHVHEPTILIARDVPEKTHITGLKQ